MTGLFRLAAAPRALFALVAVLGLRTARPLEAQAGPPPGGAPVPTAPGGLASPSQGTVAPGGGTPSAGIGKLIYRRETLDYPDAGRSDPMQPPASLAQTGGEIKLLLAGIVYNRIDPRKSQAMIRWAETPVTGGSASPDTPTARRVVQIGDSIDVYRVVGIKETSVLLQVAALGGDRTIVLERERSQAEKGQGGKRRTTGTRVTEQDAVGPAPGPASAAPPAGGTSPAPNRIPPTPISGSSPSRPPR